MNPLACLNGEWMPLSEARVSVDDRGFLFGDAVYEVMRIYGGHCWLKAAHTARLARSLTAMEFPPVDVAALMARVHRTIAESGLKEATVYIHVTRGVAPRRHAFPAPETPPTELIVVRPYDDTQTQRLRDRGVGVISYPDLRWGRCDVKSTNLLANVLANEAAHRAGAYEAILLDPDQRVTEATHSSLLWVKNGTLSGTPEGPEILPGTSRGHLLDLASREGIPFTPGLVTLAELALCPEALLVGTTIEVLPVTEIDGSSVGNGKPGPVTRRLQDAFRRDIHNWSTHQGTTHR